MLRIIRHLLKKYKSCRLFVRLVLLTIVLNLIFGGAYYLLERPLKPDLTFARSVWWAMVTMTTVGYGDEYPAGWQGRFLVAYPCMLFGIGILGYLIGITSEAIMERLRKRRLGMLPWTGKDHIVICFYPGEDKLLRIVEELRISRIYRRKAILLLDNKIGEISDRLTQAEVQLIKGDPTRREGLEKAGVTSCCGVFILAENENDTASDHQSFIVSSQLNSLTQGLPIKVVTELVSLENRELMGLSRHGGVVSGDGIIDGLLVQEFINPGTNNIIHQILTQKVGSQLLIMPHNLSGILLRNIQLEIIKHESNIQLLGIIRNNDYILNPGKDVILRQEDRLIILTDNIEEFSRIADEIKKGVVNAEY